MEKRIITSLNDTSEILTYLSRCETKIFEFYDTLTLHGVELTDADKDKIDSVLTILREISSDIQNARKSLPREWMLKSDNFGKLVVYAGPDLAPGEIISIREQLK